MDRIIAKCGYRCDLCPAFKTNLKGEEDRQRMSEALKKYYMVNLPSEMIRVCEGCQATVKMPDPNCPVYPCAMDRGVETCGHCADFGCDKLKERMDVVEEILAKHPDMPKEDFESFFKPYLSRQLLTQIHLTMNE